MAEKTLEMYDLPCPMELQNLSKLAWKRLTRQAVNSYWTQSLIREAQTNSTLENCEVTSMAVGNTYIVWEAASNNVHDVKRSIPKVRMMTDMLLRCPALADTREAPLSDIRGWARYKRVW